MCIISFTHKFIFLKTRKVAGTSVEAGLRKFTGDDDIVPCVTPRDEYYSAMRGEHSKNYAANAADEKRYTELVLAGSFEEAMAHLQAMDTKYVSHMNITRIDNIVREHGYTLDDFYKFTIDRHPYSWMISSVAYNNTKYNKGTLKPMSNRKILQLVKEKAADKDFMRSINWHMYAPEGVVMVDRVLKYENLQSELSEVLDALGLPSHDLELPDLKANVRHLDPAELMDEEAKQLVADGFGGVFKALDYEL